MKCQYSLILAVLFMIFNNVACRLNIHECGSDHGKLKYVLVSGCINGCVLKRGTYVPIMVGFTVFEKSTNDVQAVAYAEDKFTRYNLGAYLACENRGLHCPLERGTYYNYKGILNVHEDYPKMQTLVTWQLVDLRQKKIICVQFNATFV